MPTRCSWVLGAEFATQEPVAQQEHWPGTHKTSAGSSRARSIAAGAWLGRPGGIAEAFASEKLGPAPGEEPR